MNSNNLHPTPTTQRLGRSDFLHLARQPVRLAAVCGSLWVTQDGELDDVQLDAGQTRDFDGHAHLTIGTLGGDALVRVTSLAEARGSRLRRRFAAWFARRFTGLTAGQHMGRA